MDYYDEPNYPENDQSVTLNTDITVEWNREAVLGAVIERVSGLVYENIKPQVENALLTLLDTQVNTAIATLLDKEIQPTDKWGEPVGPAIRIREKLQRDAEEWLMEKVNDYGNRSDRGYDNKYPRVHWLFQQALRGEKNFRGTTALADMVIKAVKKTIGDVEDVVNKEVREHIKKILSK